MICIVADSCVLKDVVEERRTHRFWRLAYPKLQQATSSAERALLIVVREEVKSEMRERATERLSEWFRGFLPLFDMQPKAVKYRDVRSSVLRSERGKETLANIRRLFDLDPNNLGDWEGELDSDAFLLITALHYASGCSRVLVVTSDEKARCLLTSAINRLMGDPSLSEKLEKVSEP